MPIRTSRRESAMGSRYLIEAAEELGQLTMITRTCGLGRWRNLRRRRFASRAWLIVGRRILAISKASGRAEESREEGARKPPQPAQEEGEVVGGGEPGVGAVAVAALEIVAVHGCSAFKWPMTGSTAARR